MNGMCSIATGTMGCRVEVMIIVIIVRISGLVAPTHVGDVPKIDRNVAFVLLNILCTCILSSIYILLHIYMACTALFFVHIRHVKLLKLNTFDWYFS